MKVRTKVTAIILTSSIISMSLIIGLWVKSEIGNIKERQQQNVRSALRVIASSMRGAVDFEDVEALEKSLDNLFINPVVQGTAVISHANGTKKTLASRFLETVNTDIFVVSENIEKDNKVIGSLIVWVSTREINRQISEYTRKIMIISLIVFALTLIAALLMQRIIANPLTGLSNLLRKIHDGDYSARSPDNGRKDEIGELQRGFNSMAGKINEHVATLKKLADHDVLTGLHNRQYMDEILNREIDRAGRSSLPLSLIIADVDHFKDTNDTYGHDMGDFVLKSIAGMLSQSIRKTDELARWGGEEFLFILPNTILENAGKLAEKIRIKVEEMHFSVDIKITCSFGIAACDCKEDTVEALLKRADVALYRAKKLGRNRVEVEEKE